MPGKIFSKHAMCWDWFDLLTQNMLTCAGFFWDWFDLLTQNMFTRAAVSGKLPFKGVERRVVQKCLSSPPAQCTWSLSFVGYSNTPMNSNNNQTLKITTTLDAKGGGQNRSGGYLQNIGCFLVQVGRDIPTRFFGTSSGPNCESDTERVRIVFFR